ncbi:hypothetical protein C6A77_06150 [Pseudomonas sp. AFG_SD02_1510_Pfu_092]|nr:hypothetical protein C6A77_06150 [Pseudomonas sp. AFG_SD02_1510_Pfu_092]
MPFRWSARSSTRGSWRLPKGRGGSCFIGSRGGSFAGEPAPTGLSQAQALHLTCGSGFTREEAGTALRGTMIKSRPFPIPRPRCT